MIFAFGIPQERVVFGIVLLVAFGVFYNNYIVDWLETHKPYIPAQTAVEVVVGVFVVLFIYLLSVRDIEISGTDSFVLLLVYFASAGLPMVFGSDGRVSPYLDSIVRRL